MSQVLIFFRENLATILVAGLVLLALLLALRSVLRRRKQGGCAGCSSCSDCSVGCHCQEERE